jgi:hypothetical protein
VTNAVVLLDDEEDYTVIDYAGIEYICVTQRVIKVEVFSDLVKYKAIYFTNQDGQYMNIEDAMQYIDRLKG